MQLVAALFRSYGAGEKAGLLTSSGPLLSQLLEDLTVAGITTGLREDFQVGFKADGKDLLFGTVTKTVLANMRARKVKAFVYPREPGRMVGEGHLLVRPGGGR